MTTDDQDQGNNPPGKRKLSPKHVVVTYAGKKVKKEQAEVPPEILPQAPTKVLSSFIEQEGTPAQPSVNSPKTTVPPEQPQPAAQVPPPITLPPIRLQGEPEEETIDEIPEEALEEEPPVPPPPPSPTGGVQPLRGHALLPGAALLTSIIAILAVVMLTFSISSTQKSLANLEAQARNDKNSVQSLSEEAFNTLDKVKHLDQRNDNQQQSLEALKKQLEAAQLKWVELSGNTEWVLAEANYLAFMANERLKTAHDFLTAATQLEAADNRLAKLGNPALLSLRQALAKDIATLRSAPVLNKQKLWEQAGILSGTINGMNFKLLDALPPAEQPVSPPAGPAWRKTLWQSWQELKSLIRVSRVEKNKGITAALTAQEQEQILRTLQLMCAQVQWAILAENNQIYLSNLNAIKAWAEQYFTPDQAQQMVLNQIAQLEKEKVEVPLPTIDGSIQALAKALQEASSPRIAP